MMTKKVWWLVVAAAIVLLVPAVLAQPPCVPNVPTHIYLRQSVCIQVCAGDVYPPITLVGSISGPAGVPVLILELGCNHPPRCDNPNCTPVPNLPEWPFGPDPYYPGSLYGHSDCFDMWLYLQHDSLWAIEIWPYCDGCFCLTFDRQLAVELSGPFAAVAGDGEAALSWTTRSEASNDHFEILRDGQLVAAVPGLINSSVGREYSWTDRNLRNDVVYTYTLVSVSLNGERREMGVASARPSHTSATTVNEYALLQNFPNPFNPTTNIVFDLVEPGMVTLKVYNPVGEVVADLLHTRVNEAGRHTVTFDGNNLTSGLYFYTITVGDRYTATRKMLLVK